MQLQQVLKNFLFHVAFFFFLSPEEVRQATGKHTVTNAISSLRNKQ